MSDNLPPKPQLLKEWHERKGDEPWTIDDIAELIIEAYTLGQEESEIQREEFQWWGS